MRECRFYIGAEELSTAKESEASPAGRRAGLTSETGCRSDTSENERRSGSGAEGERFLLKARNVSKKKK